MIKSKLLANNFGQIVNGPLLLTPTVNKDERGAFFESWNKKEFDLLIGKNINFVQDAHSFTKRGVIRGMHYQISPFSETKIVHCLSGKIYDVVIDLTSQIESSNKPHAALVFFSVSAEIFLSNLHSPELRNQAPMRVQPPQSAAPPAARIQKIQKVRLKKNANAEQPKNNRGR